MLFLVIFFITVGGIVGQEEEECDFEKAFYECSEIPGEDNYIFLSTVPEKEEFLDKCPTAHKYFECFIEKKEKCKWEGDDDIDRLYEFVSNSYELGKDLCNEESELHKDFFSHAECYRTLEEDAQNCFSVAEAAYMNSFVLLDHEEPEDIDEEWVSNEAFCMLDAIYIACISENVLKACGEDAYGTMMKIVSKSRALNAFCSADVKDVLKTTLLDSLDLDEETKGIYSDAFNSIKK